MRIKRDENIPRRAKECLIALGHDADNVWDEKLAGSKDAHLWVVCQPNNAFLITQDLDFSDVRAFQPDAHHGILLLRLKEPGRNAVVRRLEELFRSEDVATWQRQFVIASDRKIRVIRKKGSP